MEKKQVRVVTWKPRRERMPGRRKFSKLGKRNSLAEMMRKIDISRFPLIWGS